MVQFEYEFLKVLDWNLYVDEKQRMALAQEMGCDKILRQQRLLQMMHLEKEHIAKGESQGWEFILQERQGIVHPFFLGEEDENRVDIEGDEEWTIRNIFEDARSEKNEKILNIGWQSRAEIEKLQETSMAEIEQSAAEKNKINQELIKERYHARWEEAQRRTKTKDRCSVQ